MTKSILRNYKLRAEKNNLEINSSLAREIPRRSTNRAGGFAF